MIINIKNYNKEFLAILLMSFIFIINLSIEYSKYLEFIDEEIYETKVEVLNIYKKTTKQILMLKLKISIFLLTWKKMKTFKNLTF